MNTVPMHSGAIRAGSCGAGERHLQDLADVIVVDNLRVRLEHELDGASGTFWPAMPRICGFKMRSAMRVWPRGNGMPKRTSNLALRFSQFFFWSFYDIWL